MQFQAFGNHDFQNILLRFFLRGVFSKILKKILRISVLSLFEKNAHFNSEKMTSPSRRLGYLITSYTINRLKVRFPCFSINSESQKLTFNLLTDF